LPPIIGWHAKRAGHFGGKRFEAARFFVAPQGQPAAAGLGARSRYPYPEADLLFPLYFQ
jgi:hypothetical protein